MSSMDMDDNIKSLIDDLNNAQYDIGQMSAKISTLHNLVDDEEFSTAERGYPSSAISSVWIRRIFGWGENPKVKQIRDAREAENKKNESMAE